jgi:transposase InsO family protein
LLDLSAICRQLPRISPRNPLMMANAAETVAVLLAASARLLREISRRAVAAWPPTHADRVPVCASADDLRLRWLEMLPRFVTRPGMYAVDGRAYDIQARTLLADLCFLDERDADKDSVHHALRGYGKLGVIGPFTALFGQDDRYVDEVASVFAEQFHRLGYLAVDRTLDPADWSDLRAGLHQRFDGRDVRRSEVPAAVTVTDLVKRNYHRDGPNQLWVTDIIEHPTREGKLYCCVVLDTFSRRVVGWAVDSRQQADLATNALGMAIDSRGAVDGAIIDGDHGTQFTSWTFTQRARNAGLLPSLGTIGDPYDNAVIESFWARMQVELLNRKKWKTRVELANAIFEYIEGFHNRRRRHSALAWKSPLEFETIHTRQLTSLHR